MNTINVAAPLSVKEAKITGRFWKDFMDKILKQIIPYQWEALNDRIEGAEPSFSMRNFRVASGKEKGEFGGRVFQDSDVAKWLEAVAYSLMWHPDAKLEKTADEAIDDIVAAQQPDGYLNTYYIINGLNKRFTNLKENHELYCLGHFLEAAVAYYEATGKDKLLKAMVKYVDLVDSLMGPEEGKIRGYPGHQEIELALVRLYKITKNEKHLRLAKYFIDERGKEPLFFREEGEKYGNEFPWKDSLFQYNYYQAGEPVREQRHAIGHAVRAVYMYAGMTDIACQTGDDSLLEVCRRLWTDVTCRQMYITGGIGSSGYGEAFTFGYDLPNDTVYAETCASIALAFFARRMFNLEPKREYTDVLELALYNGIISGMSADGKSFFYVNPLEVVPEAIEKDQLRSHVKPVRQKWFGCSCCPPNLARILSSLGSYVYSKWENKNTFFINLFVEGEVSTNLDGPLKLQVKTNYPWEGSVNVAVDKISDKAVIAVRIPGWCDDYSIKNQNSRVKIQERDGYAYFTGLKSGDSFTLEMEMPVALWEANPKVRENIGKVTAKRGPVVYCIEEADNGPDLHRVFVDKNVENSKFEHNYEEGFFGGAVLIKSKARRLKQSDWDDTALYRKSKGFDSIKYEEVSLKWIPYYLWANRGIGEMTTWVRTL